jgi:hypothetical protein
MTKGLHKRAARAAARDGVSLNQFIVTCIAEEVGARARPVMLYQQPQAFRRNVDNRLGELVGVAGRLGCLSVTINPLSGLSMSKAHKHFNTRFYGRPLAGKILKRLLYQLVVLVNFPLIGRGSATTTPLNCEPVCHAAICAPNRTFSTPELCHNQTDPLPKRG